MANAALTPYAFQKSPASYDAGQEDRHRIRIAQGHRAIAIRTVLPSASTQEKTITAADETVLADTTTGAVSLTLPAVDGSKLLKVTVLNIGAGTMTVVGTVSGTPNPTFAQFEGGTIVSDGTQFLQIGSV